MNLIEQETIKYQKIWELDIYRTWSPGECLVDEFIECAGATGGTVIDYGTGTGRAAVKLTNAGFDVTLVDLVGNCLDPVAYTKLGHKLVLEDPRYYLDKSDFAFCTDVLEHIPPEKINQTLAAIQDRCSYGFFSISYTEDSLGRLIGEKLHLTVKPHIWWLNKLGNYCLEIRSLNEGIFWVTFKEPAAA